MKRSLLLSLLLFSLLFGREEGPWLPSLLEFQSSFGYHYDHTECVQSPLGSFSYRDDYHTLFATLELPFLPGFSLDGYLGFVQSNRFSFSYELFASRVRRQWLDDLCGSPFALTTSLSFAFPANRLLHDFNYAFHGHTNIEFDLSLGKEFALWRFWLLGGYGIAERGAPWLRGKVALEGMFSDCIFLTLYTEVLYGLGKRNLFPEAFEGYALIHHQRIDLGANLDYNLLTYGTLSLSVYLILHAYNFIENGYGGQLLLSFPFSL